MSKIIAGPLGPFILKSARGETRACNTVVEAAEAIRCGGLEMVDRPFGGAWVGGDDMPGAGRNWVLFDECGLIVPLWRIEEALAALPPRRSAIVRYEYDRDKHFRNGPLPLRHGHWRGRFFRHMRTTAELRAHSGLEADLQDLEEFPVRVKIRARRKKLPMLWDDVLHSRRGDGWKNYRKTQYKPWNRG